MHCTSHMGKRLLLLLLSIGCCLAGFAAESYTLRGRVIDRLTRRPVAYAAVVLDGQGDKGASTDSTGRFAIETDEELGAIIYGNYDYSVGDWQHRYIVTDFSKTQMIWTAKDDRSDISVYERCDGIPEEITGGKTE